MIRKYRLQRIFLDKVVWLNSKTCSLFLRIHSIQMKRHRIPILMNIRSVIILGKEKKLKEKIPAI